MAKKSTSAKKPGKGRSAAPNQEALIRFARAEAARFLDQPNINSVGIGFKDRDGKPTSELAVQFTVDRKYTPEELTSLEGLDKTPMIPKSFTIDGIEIPTDVVERKFQPTYQIVAEQAKSFRKSRQPRLTPGISVSNARSTAGTLGSSFTMRKTERPTC